MKLTIEEAKRIMAENNGDLPLSKRTDIDSLPEGLVVERDLIINRRKEPIELPTGLVVGGRCSLYGSHGIDHLPTGLKIVGPLYMNRTNIEEIPADAKIGSRIDASYSRLKKIPNGFNVYGDFILTGSEIETIPEFLTVHGLLAIDYTKITELSLHIHAEKIAYEDSGVTAKNVELVLACPY